MGSFWGLSAALVLFREQGILRRFHVTPVTPPDMLASSMLANYVLTVPTVIVELLFARFFFNVRDFGDISSLFILVTVGVLSFGSMGLVVASVTNTMQETQVINQLIWLPMIFLSGATVPLASLPKVVQAVSVFLPATYLVRGLQASLVNNAHPWNILWEIGALTFWMILTFFVSSQLFRWEPESKIPRRAKLFAVLTAIPFLLLGIWESKTGHLQNASRQMLESLDKRPATAPPPDKPPVDTQQK